MFLGSRTIGNHGFQIGPQNRPDAGLAGHIERLALVWYCRISPHCGDLLARYRVRRAVCTESNRRQSWLDQENGNRPLRRLCGIERREKGLVRPEPYNSDWGIVDLGLSCFRTYGEPNLARNLKRQVMELKGGDEANDPFGYKLRNFGKIVRCCHFGIGELVETARVTRVRVCSSSMRASVSWWIPASLSSTPRIGPQALRRAAARSFCEFIGTVNM